MMSRFSEIEVDNGKAQPMPAKLAAQETDTSKTHGDIDAAGRARAIASAELAEQAGLVPSEATFFSFGTRGQWGDTARKAREEHKTRPLASKLLGDVQEQVKAEARRSDTLTLPDLRYSLTDRIGRAGKPGAKMSDHAFRQLLGRAGAAPYAAGYLSSKRVPSALRAPHVEHWLGSAYTDGRKSTAAFLSKMSGAERMIYGVVSDRYQRYDLDSVARAVATVLPSDARAQCIYDPTATRWRMDLSLGAEWEPVVGDIHRVTLRMKSSDAGDGAIVVQLLAERVRCLNFSQIRLSGKLNRVRHIGDVRQRVGALLRSQGEVLTDFSRAWQDANQTAIIDGAQSAGDARAVFRALIQAGHVDAADGEDLAVERFFNAWLKEPGQNRADYVNAITRAAHEAPWSTPWVTDALEEQAGELLYNRVVLTPSQIGR